MPKRKGLGIITWVLIGLVIYSIYYYITLDKSELEPECVVEADCHPSDYVPSCDTYYDCINGECFSGPAECIDKT